MTAHLLVVAKAPVAGRVKTRLGAEIGMDAAAQVAASSLLDSVLACTAAAGAGRASKIVSSLSAISIVPAALSCTRKYSSSRPILPSRVESRHVFVTCASRLSAA